MHVSRLHGLPWAACAIVSATGCLTLKTTEVRLRDPAQAALYKGDATSEPVIAKGLVTSGTLDAKKYFVPFHWQHYTIEAIREPSGFLRLHCDGCSPSALSIVLAGFSGITDVPLITQDGVIPFSDSTQVSVDTAQLTASQKICWVRRATSDWSFCEAESRSAVVVPLDDVATIHNHYQPPRLWGAILTTVGGLGLAAAASAVALTAPNRTAMALGGAVIGVPSVTMVVFGLWNLLTPARDDYQTFTPQLSANAAFR